MTPKSRTLLATTSSFLSVSFCILPVEYFKPIFIIRDHELKKFLSSLIRDALAVLFVLVFDKLNPKYVVEFIVRHLNFS